MEYVKDGDYEDLKEEHCEEYKYLKNHVIPLMRLIERTLMDEGLTKSQIEKVLPIITSKTIKDRYYWKKEKQREGAFTRGDRYGE